MGFHYKTYYYIAFVVPLIFLCICFLLVLAAIYTLVLSSLSCLKLSFTCPSFITQFNGGMKAFFFEGLKLIYGDKLKKCKKNDTVTYTLFGHRVRTWVMAVLFLVFTFVCCCTVVAFWSEFLVSETNHCDTSSHTIDCFVQNISQDGYGEYIPVMENCSDYENDNFTVSCFKFVFDYAGALGNTGGVLVLASVIMNVQSGLWIGAVAIKRKIWKILAVCALLVSLILASIFTLCLCTVVPGVQLFSEPILGTRRKILTFYVYVSTFILAFIFSGPVITISFFKKIMKFCFRGQDMDFTESV